MGIVFDREPLMQKPAMVASWSGIGNIGLLALETLRAQTQAEYLGEIEPWDFFYPSGVMIKGGILEAMEFPTSRFYHKKYGEKDYIFFLGEEQPPDSGWKKGYRLAKLVLDVAEKFGCGRIYTLGAAVAATHHALDSKVWIAASDEKLIRELKSYRNTVGMSDIEGRGSGSITGLNGLVFGLARKRKLDAICLMGEIPDYLSGAPFPYPRASKAVLDVLTGLLGIPVGYDNLDEMGHHMNELIESIYNKFPQEMKGRVEQRKLTAQPKTEAITEEEEKWLKEHIDELFKKGESGQ
ncbi:MAG: PAC2 family protein [Chloroflexi bacterium]|nr:PAC2 family protein [Chloroflexota bacterium]